MNQAQNIQRLREIAWRRPLTLAEEAELRECLQGQSEALIEWEHDAELSRQLFGLQDAPVPSNFTARVMHQIELEESRAGQQGYHAIKRWSWRRWIPRFAVAVMLLAAGLFGYKLREEQRAAELGRTLHLIATTDVVPPPDALENFDEISRLSGQADLNLLASLE